MKLPFAVPKTMPMERVFEKIVRDCADQIPTNWCDPLLSGPAAVKIADCRQIEALLLAIKKRTLARYGLGPKP